MNSTQNEIQTKTIPFILTATLGIALLFLGFILLVQATITVIDENFNLIWFGLSFASLWSGVYIVYRALKLEIEQKDDVMVKNN